jgi:hypothetical protein
LKNDVNYEIVFKAIIIDEIILNFNPYLIARRLIQTEKEFAKLIEPDPSYPGKFLWKKPKLLRQ